MIIILAIKITFVSDFMYYLYTLIYVLLLKNDTLSILCVDNAHNTLKKIKKNKES